MKNINRLIWVVGCLFFVLTACDREKLEYGLEEEGKGEGSLQLSIALNVDAEIEDADTKAVTKAPIKTDDFLIKLYNEENALVAQYNYAEMPEIVTLKTGKYRLEAHSHELDLTAAKWNSPYYYGDQNFTIKENEVTKINTVTCYMRNIKVQIDLDNNLYKAVEDDMIITALLGNIKLEYTKLTTGNQSGISGYFPATADGNTLILILEGTIEGEEIYLRKSYTNISQGDYLRVTFEYKSNGGDNEIVGDAGLDLIIADCEKIEKDVNVPAEEGTIDDPDDEDDGGKDPDPGPGPGEPNPDEYIEIVARGFDIDQVQILPIASCIVDITAEKGIKHLYVRISSETLMEDPDMELLEYFDLVNPGAAEGILGSLQLPIKDQVEGKTSLEFNITMFTGLLLDFDGTHSFELHVIDMENNELTKTLTLITQ